MGRCREADLGVHAEAHLAFLAFLGGDDDNPVGGTRTIDGGGAGVLKQGDALDVFRVEGRQRVGTRTVGIVAHTHGTCHNGNTVYNIEGGVARRERACTADTHRSGRTGLAGSRRNLHTGNATLQGVDDVRLGLTLDDIFAYRNGRTYIVYFLLNPVTAGGNLYFLHHDGRGFHLDIHHTTRDRHDLLFQTHGRKLEILGRGGHIVQGEDTVEIGGCTHGGPFYLNSDHRNPVGFLGTGDLTCDSALSQSDIGRSHEKQ